MEMAIADSVKSIDIENNEMQLTSEPHGNTLTVQVLLKCR